MTYVVVFRSRVKPDADRALMRALDDAAFEEASLSGGLLDYVRGSDDGAKASVCVWEAKEDAKRASTLPAHTQALRMAPVIYDWWTVDTYGD